MSASPVTLSPVRRVAFCLLRAREIGIANAIACYIDRKMRKDDKTHGFLHIYRVFLNEKKTTQKY
jgi:hypothetical protein